MQALKEAFELIKSGKKSQAVDLLLPVLKADEDNADAWWLIANALEEPDEIREALENVLRLQPQREKARQMLERLNQRFPPRPKHDDEFSFDDDPFADDVVEDYQPKIYQKGKGAVPLNEYGKVTVKKSKSSGTSPLVIILAVVGVITVIGCVACLALPMLGVSLFGQAIEQAVSDPTFQAAMEEIAESITMVAGEGSGSPYLSGDVRMQGAIDLGQSVRGSIGMFDEDGWTFSASGGSQVTIEVMAISADLDPYVYLYGVDGQLIAENDDIVLLTDMNSRLVVTLPTGGVYTIVVGSPFSAGGEYELILR